MIVLITILLDINIFLHLQGLESESVPLSNLRGSGTRLDPSLIVVAVFENQTGDPKLDPVGRMAADWIMQGAATDGTGCGSPNTAR